MAVVRTLHWVHSNRSTTFLVVFALCDGINMLNNLRGVWHPYLVEDGLGLTTITTLLAIITTLSLGEQRGFAGLVLCDLVLSVCQLLV